jgi:tetratricopeptide (TPR) repeat protein
LRLAGALTRYWEVRSYLTEGYEQFQMLLARADHNVPPAVRAKAELGAGRLSWCQDRDVDALRHYRAAQSLYQNLGMMEQVGIIEAYLGFTERNEGNNQAARAHFERAKIIGDEQRSERVLAMAVNGLVSLAADEGDFVTAREAKERSLVSARSVGDPWAVAFVIGTLAKVCFAAGDFAAARACIHESLKIARDLGNKWAVPYVLEGLADICARENEAQKAVQLYGAASAQRETFALAFSATERTSYQKALAHLHELVPDESFNREWERGRSLGPQAAIELAVETEAPKRAPARRKRGVAFEPLDAADHGALLLLAAEACAELKC